MGFNETMYKDFNKECINKFGNIMGNTIILDAEQRLEKMISEIDDRNSETIRWHLEKCLLPTIAMYLSFKKRDDTCNVAYSITLNICQEVAVKQKKRMQFIGSIPFGYSIFKFLAKRQILKMYPEVGWCTKWIRYDKEEIHFNYHSCLYKETADKYKCAEMCSIFCANDVTIFSGFAPNILFERSDTLANGNEKCDFHFKNSKYIK
ncbi:L-2-amino-thiazoline-4-carboxylic acid hydrolase [Clostridium sp. UBA6640]|uniref:L-2-amino-thiazoline-4-carboxylic acid hydrolase n=1 Tax=Clostridium sp. UBA6640 TaxID=1946370 RepID=UPI0025BD19EC|nr:L-2-amino-thiazoline-4-carboxylic acid hydrolase [Clostridium sp. UBA6640]